MKTKAQKMECENKKINTNPMAKKNLVQEIIIQQGLLPLYFNADLEMSIEILRVLYKAGSRVVEYTNRGETAFANFKKLIELKKKKMPDLMLGIGTIKNLEQAKSYIEIGADFFVSPGLVLDVAKYAVSNDILYVPGCMTPTEIIAAENIGLKFIKLFPGNVLGIEFMSSLKSIFPKLYFMPTGGVDTTKENIENWFEAGVCAVGMGSKLISNSLIEGKNFAEIEKQTKKLLEIISTIKTK